MTETTIAPGLIAGTWQIDPAHSEITFNVRHLMTTVRGSFTEFTVPPATSIANQTRTRIQRIEPDHGWDHMPMLIHILLPKWNNPTGH